MQKVIDIENKETLPNQKPKPYSASQSADAPILNKKGHVDGLIGGKLVEDKKGGLAIKARSTIKFIFQILIGIFIYIMVLGTLMILKIDVPLYSHILMISILFCAVGVGISITLYIFYPLIAPRVFDLHHGFFYTKPLSSYIHIILWDSTNINITPLHKIDAIQIIRIERHDGRRHYIVDQTNIVLKDGKRIALMMRKNARISQTKNDAEKLATRLAISVQDAGIAYL